MKIIKLKVENIKGIKAVELNPQEGLVVLSGRNGQGKTSILDSISYALGGERMIPSEPIRQGEDRGEVTVEMDKYTVRRIFTKSGSRLEVTSKDNAVYKNPQQLLDSIMGELSFDPLEFSRLDGKKQKQKLLELIGVNTDEYDKKKEELSNERLIVGREGKKIKGYFDSLPVPKVKSTDEKINVFELSQKISEIKESNRNIDTLTNSVEQLKARIAEIENNLKLANEALINTLSQLDKAGSKIDTVELEIKLQQAESINNAIVSAGRYEEAKKEVEEKRTEYENLTTQIEQVEKDKNEALQKSKMPVSDLGVSDSAVTYKNIPFDQLSAAEQLKVSMAIAMASNPNVRVILVRDASLLDEANMAVIKEMATDKDFQIWMEVVDSTGQVGFYIEDGVVLAPITNFTNSPKGA